MANKKISELTTRTPSLSDLILVGDPSNGFSYKCTVTALATIIETDIADGYVTLGTTQTISGAKTFSNNLTLTSVANATTDPDKFLVLNGSNIVNYRTGSEVLSDIGGQATISLTTTGTSGAATFTSNTLNIPQYQGAITLTTTGTSGAATLVGNTLNIPNYAPDLSGYVPTSRTITINGTTQDLTANRTYNVGTVTSVAASGGTGISISGSPITSSGTITITNTAPDQIVALTAGTGISISGTYPNFTITNSSPSLGGTVTSVALSAPTGFAVTGSPITSSGTLALAFDTGYSLPTTASQTNWDSAYNNMIVSAAVTGTTTKTLTLTQQDAGTITASWTDDNTDAVTSVFGRTGAVVATEGDYSLTQLSDVTITSPTTGQVLKYNGTIWVNDTDANTGTVTSVALSAPTGFSVSGSPITSSGTLALSFASGYSLPTNTSQSNWDTAYTNRITSLTTTGSSGSATLISNTLNIPTYTLAGLGGISLTSLSAFVPLSYNNTTGQFSITKATSVNDGYLSATDWNTFNNKQATITLTTTGTSGAATFTSNTLNIPQYQGALTLTTTGTSGAATLVGNTLNIPQYSGGGGTVSGTTNYIAKFTSSTAVGDSLLFDDGTNVGVGTATAGSKLQVNGNAAIGYSSSTAAPTNGLQVAGQVIVSNELLINGGSLGSANGLHQWYNTSTNQAWIQAFQSGVDWRPLNINAQIQNFLINDVTTLYISNARNVGIGTGAAASNTKLQVLGSTLTAATQSSYALGIGNSSGYDLTFGSDATYTYIQSWSSKPLYINSQGNNTIFGSGNVGINTTTIGSRLQVNGNAAIGYSASTAAPTNGLAVSGNVGVGTSSPNFTTANRTVLDINGTSTSLLGFSTGGTSRGYIFHGGTDMTVANFNNGGTLEINTFGADGDNTRMAVTSTGIVFVGNKATAASPSTGIISGTGGSGTNIAGAEFRIRGGASTGNAAGGPITFYTSAAGTSGTTVNAAAERMRITNTGVGIGTTTTDNIAANTGMNLIVQGSTSGANVGWVQAISFDAATSVALYSGQTTSDNPAIVYQKDLRIGNATGTGVGSFAERVRIANGGNVGIGTSTIGSRLQVNGGAAIGYSASTAAPTNGLAVSGNVGIGTNSPSGRLDLSSSSDNYLNILTSGAASAAVLNMFNSVSGGDGAAIGYNIALRFGTVTGVNAAGFTERMRITSGGQVTLATGANVSAIAQTGYSLTGSNASSLLDLAGTWNTTGNPTAIKLNITNTASGASAYLMDLQVGGATQFRVTKAGAIRTAAPSGGTANDWKLGSLVTGTVCGTTNDWLEVEVGGTVYKLALALTSC